MIFKSIVPLWLLISLATLLAIALVFCLVKKTFRTKQNFRLIAVLFLGVLMLARPQLPNGNIETRDNNIDVFFAVDTTGSMAAKDMQGNKRRLEQAKEDIVTIAKQIPGARYTVLAQSAVSYQATPLISDIDALENAANGLFYPTTYASKGSSLSDLLKLSAEEAGKNEKDKERPKVFFLLSDGEETNNKNSSIPDDFDKIFAAGTVIGYGSENGATVPSVKSNSCYGKGADCEDFIIDDNSPVTDYEEVDSGYGYISHKSVKHISKLNTSNLENIAQAAGVKYLTRNELSSLDSISKEILNNGKIKSAGSKEGYSDCYFIFAGITIILLFWILSDLIVKLLSERKVSND